jgi:methionyl-tRNA formyltransferase
VLLYLSRKTDLVAVFTDNSSLSIIEFCKEKSIPFFAGNPRKFKARSFYEKIEKIEVILSINYLFLIESDLINLPQRYIINIHGALLPKYRGRTPHVWSIINGETKTGVTAHFIDEGCDTGNIILQKEILIEKEDTGANLLDKYEPVYFQIIDQLLAMLEMGDISSYEQDDSQSSYFGKRTQNDGRIIWSWGKHRIYNWIRAQAKPYPGAFAFVNGKKIIIHKVKEIDILPSLNDENGKVVKFNDLYPVIKTSDGYLEILDFEYEGILSINDKLE